MSLNPGTFVVQYLNSRHRYGVVNKRDYVDKDTGWSYFKVFWPDGSTSVERADKLKEIDVTSTVDSLLKLKEKIC